MILHAELPAPAQSRTRFTRPEHVRFVWIKVCSSREPVTRTDRGRAIRCGRAAEVDGERWVGLRVASIDAVDDIRSSCHTSPKLGLKQCSADRVLKDLIGYAMFVQLCTAHDGTEVGSNMIPEEGPGDAKIKRTSLHQRQGLHRAPPLGTNTGTNAIRIGNATRFYCKG